MNTHRARAMTAPNAQKSLNKAFDAILNVINLARPSGESQWDYETARHETECLYTALSRLYGTGKGP